MCRGEGVERTESGSGTESYHLEGPSDGNCTVERRDAGVCVPSAYVYTYIYIYILRWTNIHAHTVPLL